MSSYESEDYTEGVEPLISEISSDEVSGASNCIMSGDETSESGYTEVYREGEREPNLSDEIPSHYGRYRVLGALGEGGFGQVFRALDEDLRRVVAIKVTKSNLSRNIFLREAQILASLDHSRIVPVFDYGNTSEGEFFLVSKLIDGSNLATRIKRNRPDLLLSLQIVESIALALQHSHSKGLVHRDIKPSNILIDRNDEAWLTDYGIAMSESGNPRSIIQAFTPSYMSPEQARSEGHLINNRTDIYSLGVVFFELLTGRRPFPKSDLATLKTRISCEDVPSPRNFNEKIPVEIERICLRALARRASERFSEAKEFADELRWVINHLSPAIETSSAIPRQIDATMLASSNQDTPVVDHALAANPEDMVSSRKIDTFVQVVPKGLRSFDSGDSDFFLELLPGPVDRNGHPDAVRIWHSKIVSKNPEDTFRVGIIYGPSGCGKTSLIKAGLLPRLPDPILPVYVEATSTSTAQQIQKSVSRIIPDASGSSLSELIGDIRRRRLVPQAGKLLIVIDQFEQWLHAEHSFASADLTDALRQCDGNTVQAIVMVRDDFWISLTRFMHELDIPIVERDNVGMVDLFSIDHAARVLTLFGKAFGKLPDNPAEITKDQALFIRKAVTGLAQDNKVISVRLAIFAEMMKNRPWTPEALAKVGGIEGVGLTFLEDNFGDRHSPIAHRTHSTAVKGLLASLLPTSGTDIKGAVRSVDELKVYAGYENKIPQFDELIGILDKSLRLITPVEDNDTQIKSDFILESPEPPSTYSEFNEPSALASTIENKQTSKPVYYQLTHDYLVPSLRDWLSRKKRETRAGRAQIKLEERTAVWLMNQENRQLPTLGEWLSICRHIPYRRWSEPERLMMHRAKRVHGQNWGGAFAGLLILTFSIFFWVRNKERENLMIQIDHSIDILSKNLGLSIFYNLNNLQSIQVNRNVPASLITDKIRLKYDSSTDSDSKLALAYGISKFDMPEWAYLVARIADLDLSETANWTDAMASRADHSVLFLKESAAACNHVSEYRKKARLAIASLALADTELAENMCQTDHMADINQRSIFIDEFPRWEWHLPQRSLNLGKLADLVRHSRNPALRSALCLSVGAIPSERLMRTDPAAREAWISLMSQWFAESPDTATHGAAAWALRQWNVSLKSVADQNKIRSDREWFVNSLGMTFMHIRNDRIQDKSKPALKGRRLMDLNRIPDADLGRFPGLMMERLMLLCNAGEFNSALKELAKLENTPNPDKDLFLYKALALNSLGRYDQADEALNKYSTLKAGEFWNIDFYKWNEDSKSIPHDWEKIIRSPKSSELKTKQSDFLFDTNHTEGLALSDKFAFAANSQLYIPYDGLNVKLIYDDGIRVYLDEMIIFENWQINHAKPEIIKIDATEGFHQIRVEYFQNEGAFAIGWKPLVSKSRISPLYVNISKLILQNKFDEAISLIQLNSRNPQGLMTNNEVLSHSRCFALLAMAIKTSHPDTSDQFKQNAIDLIESNIINNDIENSFSFNDINTIQEFQWIFQDHDNAIFMKDNEVMDFWIASNEVTYDLFLLFNNDPDALPEEKADQWNDYDKRVTPAPETPAHHVNVFDTILFCNWLSRREGRKPCYRKSGNSVQFGQDHFHNEWLLDKKADGYRLPLEYEWELACRAGTMTEWSTGSNEELVKSYSHLNSNKPTLVSTPRVNPWGLANMHGNLWEWCYDKPGIDNFARGGSFNNDPINCRSTSRFINSPHFRSNSIGFRIVLNNPPQANPVKSPGNE